MSDIDQVDAWVTRWREQAETWGLDRWVTRVEFAVGAPKRGHQARGWPGTVAAWEAPPRPHGPTSTTVASLCKQFGCRKWGNGDDRGYEYRFYRPDTLFGFVDRDERGRRAERSPIYWYPTFEPVQDWPSRVHLIVAATELALHDAAELAVLADTVRPDSQDGLTLSAWFDRLSAHPIWPHDKFSHHHVPLVRIEFSFHPLTEHAIAF